MDYQYPSRRVALPVILFTFFLLTITITPAIAQDVGAGLKFASAEELRGIPLAATPYAGDELPSRVDLSGNFPPPGFQGKQNSCVGWAVAYALKSFQEKNEIGYSLTLSNGSVNSSRVFSPAFIYNQINNGVDGGSFFFQALNLLHEQGAATLSDMPYNPADFRSQPPAQARENAKQFRIDTWRQVNVHDPRELKAHLNANYPIVIGAMIDQGFMQLQAGEIWRAPRGSQGGGHAMVLVGYDDSRSAFKVINSWGQQWADGGYGWIAYSYFSSVVREGYVALDAKNSGAPSTTEPTPNADELPVAPPDPFADQAIDFQITNVMHNAQVPGYGNCMRFDGTVNIPANVSGSVQVVIEFYLNNGMNQAGPPVRAIFPQFMSAQGNATTGTPPLPIPPQGLQQTWFAIIPYNVLDLPRGIQMGPMGPFGMPITSNLVAHPVLYKDGFGIRKGGYIPFFVQL